MTKYTPKLLERTQFGNPILVTRSLQLKETEIKSVEVQHLIADITHTLRSKKYGVGLAAPQVNHPIALSVIDIQPKSQNHTKTEIFTQVIINPKIIKGIGTKVPMWEGCLSFGAKNSPVFAQTLRYEEVKVKYYDEKAKLHETILKGLPAHVFQHETDHLNGVLFPERVSDHSTWMNASEYRKMKRSQEAE